MQKQSRLAVTVRISSRQRLRAVPGQVTSLSTFITASIVLLPRLLRIWFTAVSTSTSPKHGSAYVPTTSTTVARTARIGITRSQLVSLTTTKTACKVSPTLIRSMTNFEALRALNRGSLYLRKTSTFWSCMTRRQAKLACHRLGNRGRLCLVPRLIHLHRLSIRLRHPSSPIGKRCRVERRQVSTIVIPKLHCLNSRPVFQSRCPPPSLWAFIHLLIVWFHHFIPRRCCSIPTPELSSFSPRPRLLPIIDGIRYRPYRNKSLGVER